MKRSQTCPACGAVLPEGTDDTSCPGCLIAAVSDLHPRTGQATPHAPARLFCGDYELEEQIAEGGMGVVFRARQISLNRPAAVKMIRMGAAAGTAFVRRFRTEAETAAKLDHPNIVPIYEIGEDEGRHFFSMKLIEGAGLDRRIRSGEFDFDRANATEIQAATARLLVKVARAVHHAHERGVLHRDLKPSNILIDSKGEPLLTDFGLAKLMEGSADLTRTFAVMGTAGYMSPEQASGNSREITTSADVYSLGAILYEMLSGRAPFAGEDAILVMRQVVDADPVRLRQLKPDVDAELETICLKCLEKQPARRYASALALAEDLERWLAHKPILARPVTPLGRLVKWGRRKPLLALLYGMLSLGLVAGGGVGLYIWRQLDQKLQRQQWESAIHLFESGKPAAAVDELSLLLRQYPKHSMAATRLMAALAQRPFPKLELSHPTHVNSVHFSPDGRHLVSAAGQAAWLWSVQDGTVTGALTNHMDSVTDAGFSPDGNLVVTASKDGRVRVWDWRKGEVTLELSHPGWVRSAHFSPDGKRILTLSTNEARVWDLPASTGWTQQVSGSYALCSRFSPDGSQVLAASMDGSVALWDAASGRALARLNGHTGAVRFAMFSPSGQWIVTASDDKTARVWDPRYPQDSRLVLHHEGPVVAADFHPNGQWIVTASEDKTAMIWDMVKAEKIHDLIGHEDRVSAARFSRDGTLVLTASHDGTARVWNTVTGQPWGEPAIHEIALSYRFVDMIEPAPDGRSFATVCADHAVRIWTVPAVQPLFEPLAKTAAPANYILGDEGRFAVIRAGDALEFHDLFRPRPDPPRFDVPGLNAAVLSPNHQFIFATGAEPQARLFRVGQSNGVLLNNQVPVAFASFSADDTKVLAVSGDRAQVWDTAAGRSLAGPWLHQPAIAWAGFSPDGSRAITLAAVDAHLWSVSVSGGIERTFQCKEGILAAAFGADPHHVIFNCRDNAARLWNVRENRTVVFAHPAPLRAVQLGPQNGTLLTAAASTVRVWDCRDPSQPLLEIHLPDEVNSARFSPDGRQIVTASNARSLQLWDAATGLALSDPIRAGAPVWGARFSPDGNWVIAETGSSPVFWELPPANEPVPTWLPQLCQIVMGPHQGSRARDGLGSASAIAEIRQAIALLPPSSRYARWTSWLLEDPGTRHLSPSSELTLDQYLRGL